jgi:membrane-bound lytic murein transglycosylase B
MALVLVLVLALVPKMAQAQVQRPARQGHLPAFQENPAVAEFIGHMAAVHGFDADALTGTFSAVGPNTRALALLRPSGPPPRVNPPMSPKPPESTTETWKPHGLPQPTVPIWRLYSDLFLNEECIEGGARFWRDNAAALERAHNLYGVPPEIIAALIGVETKWGERKGKFCVLEALATLAFHDPFRGEFFLGELEQFLLLSRENGLDPLGALGSYAGAIGIPQFMPSSWRKYAIDFDGDGVTNLGDSFADSIGSVANYLYMHGWKRGEPVARRAAGRENAPGETVSVEIPALPALPAGHWLGYLNYYAITRYNRSHEYAMTVFLLAEGIRARGPSGPRLCPFVRGLAVHIYVAEMCGANAGPVFAQELR